MRPKIFNRLLILLGIMFYVSTFIIPQETLNEYELFGLLFFIAPFGYLIVRALLRADQANNEERKE